MVDVQEMGWRLEPHPQLDSTQDHLRRKIATGDIIHGLVVRTLEQSAGRGQRRNDWQSSLGGSYQSLALYDPEKNFQDSRLSLYLAIGIAQSFHEASIKVTLKWPNDIYYNEKKLGGILCEHYHAHLIIGVGINVSNEIPLGATRLMGLKVDAVSDQVLLGLAKGFEHFKAQSDLPFLYAPFDLLRARELYFVDETPNSPSPKRYQAQGIRKDGALILNHGGEISYLYQGPQRAALRLWSETSATTVE
ncbi:MAG: biotin--[acetyl-CoA-carboxylase] ligase [Deinococcales bacterium]